MQQQRENQQPRRLSRRAFLRSLSITITGVFLAACGPPRSREQPGIAFGPQATPQIALPSPVPTTQEEAVDAPLAAFLTLSTVLTGVPNLSPELGRVYLQSLQRSSEFPITVTDLYQQGEFSSETPPTLEALETKGFFAQEATRKLLNKITELWYTGIYTNEAGEDTVATFVDTLAWQTLAFTKPKTICGYPGFWSEAWEPVLGSVQQ
ncbi:MAG: sugar dehydrogenase complex small subunit [Caldilineaceae bacterium]